ncbi:MAG: [acyl-carrier-protein] S-malonyltransferase [Acidobacteriota bacterium]|nr:[acyl-carrier-protein] S-malonyltransferase [Acidobacteriota bacterium]
MKIEAGKKIAFLFPGVGSQYIGMSKSLYDSFKIFKETIEEAGDVLKIDLPGMCFSPGKKEELDKLENAQAILAAFSMASYRVYMQEIGIPPLFCLGHSLGEYSALCSAGVMKFPDTLKLVRERGAAVSETAAGINGTMMWVINLEVKVVEEVCGSADASIKAEGQEVYISAYDSPTQASISGHTDALMKTARVLEQKGAIVYPLKLSGPFHCPLMKGAAEKMKGILQQYQFETPAYTVIANRDAQPYKDAGSVIDNLSLQLISPIRWRTSIEYLLEQGVDIAIEMGPKNVLKFLMQKNTDAIRVFTTDNDRDLEAIRSELLVPEDEYLKVIGRCLGAAVSTKNRNDSEEEYQERVIKPYRKIESFYNDCVAKNGRPGKEDVKEAVQTLLAILEAKKVPLKEHGFWVNRVLGNKMLNF